MSFRDPVYPLENHCSVIYENTLYVYSPQGFQSLELSTGSEWKTLPMDISLTGAECILAPQSGDANTDMMFVVGGRVNETASTWEYPGLMHYSFKEKKWDWQRSETYVTKQRINHAAIYIPGTKQILVYSGSSDPQSSGLSSESFLIDTKSPYAILSQPAGANPPLTKPMLMPWDDNHAVMVGGGADNTGIYTFGAMKVASGALEGWHDLGVAIPAPITSQETTQCTMIMGDDGSKVLETFNMGVVPNVVTRTVLLGKDGVVASQGTTVGDKTKRITIDDFPTYNATFAPELVRSGYSVAQSDADTIVFTGGNAQDPISIFNASKNSWVNATDLFTRNQLQSVLQPSASATSSSPTASATDAPAASTTAAVAPAAAPAGNKDRMLTVLGATLGTIFGIAALLILLLFCLRWRKSKNKKLQQGGYVEKDRLSFADRGAEFMKEAGGSVGQPRFAEVNGSQTSLAIIAGRANGNGHKRGMLSDGSTSGLIKKTSPLGYSEPVELSKFDLKPEPMDDRIVRQNSGRIPPQSKLTAGNLSRSRSSGWSRYFANNDATNLAAMPQDRSTFASERTSTGLDMYDHSRMYSQPLQAPPPLDIPKFENQRLSKVTTGSPTLGNSTDNLPGQPMQAELARANSGASTRSGISHDGQYLRDPVESWTPVGHDERPASSNYTGSIVADNYRDAASSYYADGTSSFYPKSAVSSFYPGQPRLGAPEIRDSTNTVFPAGNLANIQNTQQHNDDFDSFYPAPPRLGGAPDGRESTVTVFPGGDPADSRKPGGQDMSWLNLGVGK